MTEDKAPTIEELKRNTEKTKELMRALGEGVDSAVETIMGRKMAFTIILSDFGNNKISNYVSNVQRADMIEVLRETADRLEKRMDVSILTGGEDEQ